MKKELEALTRLQQQTMLLHVSFSHPIKLPKTSMTKMIGDPAVMRYHLSDWGLFQADRPRYVAAYTGLRYR